MQRAVLVVQVVSLLHQPAGATLVVASQEA